MGVEKIFAKLLAPYGIQGPTSTDTDVQLGDAAGATKFRVLDSSTAAVFTVDSDGNWASTGTGTVAGTFTASSSGLVSGGLTVSKTITGSSNMSITGTGTVSGTFTASSSAAVSGGLTVSGTLTGSSNMSITGTGTVSGTFTASSSAAVSGGLTVSGTLTGSSNMSITGTGTVSGTFTASSSAAVSGGLTVSGTLTGSSNATISGTITGSSNFALSGRTVMGNESVNSTGSITSVKYTVLTATSAKSYTLPAPAVGFEKVFFKSAVSTAALTLDTDTTGTTLDGSSATKITLDGQNQHVELFGISTSRWGVLTSTTLYGGVST